MDRKKNSSKGSSKTNLLEKAIIQQKELTEAMIGLSREVVKATDIRELARKEHIASKMQQSFNAPVNFPLMSDGRQIRPNTEAIEAMREIKRDKTPHRESLDTIAFLAERKGELSNQATALREEIAKLTGEAFKHQRKIDLLTCENDGRDKIIKQKDEMIAQLREIIKRTDVVIGYLEPKAKSKRYYVRRVDSRNILKRLSGEK